MKRLRAVGLALAAVTMGTLAGVPATSSAATAVGVSGAPDRPVTWLAAGDSYSSGEGIPGTGQTADDACAQSQRAFGPRAAKILRKTRDWSIDPLAFTACTGALISDFYNHGNQNHPDQSTWASDIGTANGRFDVVTLSFGGNDVAFADTVATCVRLPKTWKQAITSGGREGCDIDQATLEQRVEDLVDGRSTARPETPYVRGQDRATLAQFYATVAQDHLSDEGLLIVAGYPRLFAPSAQWGAWRNDSCNRVSAEDADWLGDAAERLEAALKNSVADAQNPVGNGKQIIYVSRLDQFDNNGASHSLCGNDTEWLTGLAIVSRNGEIRMQRSFHPNEIGHQVTAEEVAGKVEANLTIDTPTAPVPTIPVPNPEPAESNSTDPPTISDGSQRFGIGDEFSAMCSVAWPTAPTYTADSIIMTMHCPDVPQQFLFVQVSYPDPNLPINPSTGSVRVHGTVVNIATSAYGPKTLVVQADDVDLGS